MTRTYVFELPYALLFWIVFFWVFTPEFSIARQARIGIKESRDSSLNILLYVTAAGQFLAFLFANVRATLFPTAALLPAFFSGIALMILGSILRRYCWRVLGDYFTGDVRIREGQRVIQSGPYRWVRHPSYTAALLIFTGIGIALANWISVAVLVASSSFAYTYRALAEEKVLLAGLGEPYAEYMKNRKRFIPYIL